MTLHDSKRLLRQCLGASVLGVLCLLAGCHVLNPFHSQHQVSKALDHHTEQATLPPGVDFSDGITEDEAIAVALANNAAYQELLAQIGVSEARLYDAGLLTDPQFVVFYPLGPKQLEFTFFFVADALWLRPIRERVAELDLAAVSDQMVQNGLNLIRDVRLAHADLLFAQERAKLAGQAQELRDDITKLAQKRAKVGGISELEAATAKVEAFTAKADADRFAQEIVLSRDRLRVLLGMALGTQKLVAVASPLPQTPEQDKEHVVQAALAMRPDLRAAEIAVDSAAEAITVARRRFMLFDAVLDANSFGTAGRFEIGPGMRMTIPLFNANRGQVAIAEALWQQAMRRSVTLRDQIALEVRAAHVQTRQASQNLKTVQEEILPTLKGAIELARKNYEKGGSSYFLVLQTTGQYLTARAQELDLTVALRRAVAELERSVGNRLLTNPMSPRCAADAEPQDVVRFSEFTQEEEPCAKQD